MPGYFNDLTVSSASYVIAVAAVATAPTSPTIYGAVNSNIPVIFSGTVRAKTGNAAPIFLRNFDDTSTESQLEAGEAITFRNLDLSRLQVKAASSSVLKFQGERL